MLRVFALLAAALLLALVWRGGAALAERPAAGPALEVILAARPAPTLGAYKLFRDPAATQPAEGVIPYALTAPLYSDGAIKARYVYVPPGTSARYSPDGSFEFPVGTVLIKTFAMPADERAPAGPAQAIETRLLIRQAQGWTAQAYVWNPARTEARLALAGADAPIAFTDAAGAAQTLVWAVPNRNQCAGCHSLSGAVAPIGPTARNLNGDFAYPDPTGLRNQIARWSELGVLTGAPAPADAPRMPAADDPTAPLAARARAYLDVNCGHCHNPAGPAHTSGLDLSWAQIDPARFGVGKRPVAAGRASGGFAFAIDPGAPERSILIHRMASTDPGVMMPELGRSRVDEAGLALLRAWIAEMPEGER